MSKKQVQLSIILPVYNKQNSIQLVAELLKNIIENDLKIFDYEIIYVDDFSTDKSLEILRGISDPHAVVLQHSKNKGQLKAIETGLKGASGKVFGIYSCDMQNSFNTIVPLYAAIVEGNELAVGYRAVRSDSGMGVLLSKVFFKILSLFESKMPVEGFDYGLFNYRIYSELLKKDFDSVFLQLEALNISTKTYYLPSERINDNFDKSSWTIRNKIRYASKIFKYVFKK